MSQALYGIALGARTARTQLDREPAKAAEPIDYVLSLAEAGLAEMRSPIFDLRPQWLESEGLVATIQKHAAAQEARHGIAVTCDLCDEPNVSPGVREAVYRIVQEALTNTLKHAKAGKVRVTRKVARKRLRAEVADDGIGFGSEARHVLEDWTSGTALCFEGRVPLAPPVRVISDSGRKHSRRPSRGTLCVSQSAAAHGNRHPGPFLDNLKRLRGLTRRKRCLRLVDGAPALEC